MTIKIINSNTPTWYSNKIGKVYTAAWFNKGLDIFKVKRFNIWKMKYEFYGVYKNDAKIIKQ